MMDSYSVPGSTRAYNVLLVYFSFLAHFPLAEVHCLPWSIKHLTRDRWCTELFHLLK